MKKITNKKFSNKLIISIVCVLMLNFLFVPKAQASFGGEMMSLMIDFTAGLADAMGSLVQMGVTGRWIPAVDIQGTGEHDDEDSYWTKSEKFQYPILQISPELIFANEIQLLDANFVSKLKDASNYAIPLKDESGLKLLREIIASWYVTLRTLAIVLLLSVLIYIGIRIIISSANQEKAKYKQRLMDWVIAMCILFFMHYIMAAVTTVVDRVDRMLGDAAGIFTGLDIPSDYAPVKYVGSRTDKGESISTSKVIDFLEEKGYKDVTYKEGATLTEGNGTTTIQAYEFYSKDKKLLELLCREESNPSYKISWSIGQHSGIKDKEVTELEELISGVNENTAADKDYKKVGKTNDDSRVSTHPLKDNAETIFVSEEAVTSGTKVLYFTNFARLFLEAKVDGQDTNVPVKVAYLIIYVALITFTAIFTFRYIKRVIYIAFLTLMAPMVAVTYPIDKIKDRTSTSMGYVV